MKHIRHNLVTVALLYVLPLLPAATHRVDGLLDRDCPVAILVDFIDDLMD